MQCGYHTEVWKKVMKKKYGIYLETVGIIQQYNNHFKNVVNIRENVVQMLGKNCVCEIYRYSVGRR